MKLWTCVERKQTPLTIDFNVLGHLAFKSLNDGHFAAYHCQSA